MIELDDRPDDEFITVRLNGFQSTSEFASFGEALAQLRSDRKHLRVLFDWTRLEGWDAKDEIASSCRSWQKRSLVIERMAIVHEHQWNRQAALLGAVLRTEVRLVRSWIPRDLAKAVAWLRQI
ncbi:hypothetical protein SAMN05519103_09089 [Rhizobiales bacterium GAS113]|nr:hypothetical protein SAMN05519103_09089 [Rhizobiales bacterium GAS113]